MTVICSTFLLISPTALALGESLAYTGSVIILVIALVWFWVGIAVIRRNNRFIYKY